MTLNEFLKYVETGKPLKGDEIHQFMNEMSDEEIGRASCRERV